MITKVASFIQEHNLIQKNDIIMAAVSGGRDSMALLFILNRLKDALGFDLRACHINHGLRGEDSDMDEKLVNDECRRMSVPLQIERLSGYDLNTGEDALRRARYEKFQKILNQDTGLKIATAHHLDDQLETFLMRLAKGSYLKGLTAIPISRPGYIRPFLSLKREEIDDFVKAKGISFREDFTNSDTRKLRNNIRRSLTPRLINVFGADFYAGFEKSMDDLRNVYRDYRDLARTSFAKVVKNEEDALSIGRREYQQFSNNLQRLLIEYCISLLNPLNSDSIKYSFAAFEHFVNESQTGGRFLFDDRLSALIDRKNIRFIIDEQVEDVNIAINLNETVKIFNALVSLRGVSAEDVEYSADKNVEYICGDRLRFPLRLRTWRKGDAFRPLGMRGRQKLSDFLINRKIASDRKNRILILENGGEIIWVVGLQIDNRYKINKKCKQIIRLQQKIKRRK